MLPLAAVDIYQAGSSLARSRSRWSKRSFWVSSEPAGDSHLGVEVGQPFRQGVHARDGILQYRARVAGELGQIAVHRVDRGGQVAPSETTTARDPYRSRFRPGSAAARRFRSDP